MLRNMLVERFGLRYHRETREVKSFELRQDPRGHKMKDSTHDAPPKRGESFSIGSRFGADGYLEYPTGVTIRAGFKGRWRWQSVQQPMEDIVRQLDGMLGGPVANKTGLDGNYDFVLSYSQEMAATPEAAENEFSFPPLRAALRDQLGLIAVETKGPMELIVIDAINKTPTEN
jgi:uncharacterized protein (TIGR03435 family)